MARLGWLLGVYWRLLGAQVRSQRVYRTSFFLDAFGTGFLTLTEVMALVLVLPRFGGLSGWPLSELALLYGLAEFSFTLMDFVFGGFDAPNMSEHVRSGSFNTFLLRPLPLPLQVFGSDFATRRVGRLLVAGGLLAYGLRAAPVEWTVGGGLLILSCMVGLVAYFGGLYVLGGALTFWTVESVEAVNVLTYGGRTMISYPMTIYGERLRELFTYILPAAFLSYFPVLHLLGRPLPDGLPGWVVLLSPLAGGAVLGAGMLLWTVGVRHYQGTGT